MAEKTKLWYLSNNDLFKGLSDKEKKWASGKTAMNHFKKGECIINADSPKDSVFFLKAGLVKITHLSREGQELTIDILKPGSLFGYLLFNLGSDNMNYSYIEAVENSTVCSMTENNFAELLQMKPDLGLKMVKLMGLQLKKIEIKFANLAFKSVKQRIADLLLKLSEEYGSLKLTHEEISKMIASTRETTTLNLNILKRDGFIDICSKGIIIKNKEDLAELANQA